MPMFEPDTTTFATLALSAPSRARPKPKLRTTPFSTLTLSKPLSAIPLSGAPPSPRRVNPRRSIVIFSAPTITPSPVQDRSWVRNALVVTVWPQLEIDVPDDPLPAPGAASTTIAATNIPKAGTFRLPKRMALLSLPQGRRRCLPGLEYGSRAENAQVP
jgi:hypothetical protein